MKLPAASLLFLYSFRGLPLRKKCPNTEFFWSVFSRIRIEYGEIRRIFPYSVQMWENTDQKKTPYLGNFHAVHPKRFFLVHPSINSIRNKFGSVVS